MRISLSRLVLFALLIAACRAIGLGTFPQQELSLDVTVITSEHSKDSHSLTAKLKVSANTLLYEETYHGARANRHPPVKKEYKLTSEDRDRLIKMLKEGNLLTSKTISNSSEEQGISRDFKLVIQFRLADQQGEVSISSPRSATELKNDPFYQSSLSLLVELYRVIQRTDGDIAVPDLIH